MRFLMITAVFSGAMMQCLFAAEDGCASCHADTTKLMKSNPHVALESGCLACHSSHGTNVPTAKDKTFWLKAPAAALCRGCHAGILQKEFSHPPAKIDCTLCHDVHNGSGKELRTKSNGLCLECHSAAAKARFETDGPTTLFGGQVTLPHGFFHDVPVLALTNDRGHPVANHPVLRDEDKDWPAVECLTCHNPHGANKSRVFLVTETETFEQVCLRCHK